MSLGMFNRQSVFLTPTPLFFALTGERCRKSWAESTRDSPDQGKPRRAPGGQRLVEELDWVAWPCPPMRDGKRTGDHGRESFCSVCFLCSVWPKEAASSSTFPTASS